MRIVRGLLLSFVLLGSAGVLAGCDTIENFQFWDTKKKLPGARKDVFPEGVPGVTQGIPPELMKGYQEPQQQAVDPTATAAQETAEKEAKPEQKGEPKAKAKPKPKKVAQPRAPSVQPEAAQPQPAPSFQQAPPPQQAPWPGSQPQAQQQTAPWPSQR
jgi:hypothetical protein